MKIKALNDYVLIKEDNKGPKQVSKIILMNPKKDDSGEYKIGTVVSIDEKYTKDVKQGDRVWFQVVQHYDKEYLGGNRICRHGHIIAVVDTPVGEELKISHILKLVA